MPVTGGSPSTAKGVTITLSDVIDDALDLLYRDDERPQQSTLLSSATNTSSPLAVVAGLTLSATDLVEVERELMLVTGGTSTAPTVTRGYAGTAGAAHASGAVILKNPQWKRNAIYKAILRGVNRILQVHLPLLVTTTVTPTSGRYYIDMPTDCIEVKRVGYFTPVQSNTSGAQKWREIADWQLVEHMPLSGIAGSSTGQLLTLPTNLPFSTSTVVTLYVTYQQRYAWSGGTATPAESETIIVPYGAEDILSLYAAAFLVSGREISRLELDKVEEWNRQEPLRTSTNLRTVAQRWAELYRAIDECRKLQHVPIHRPFRKMARGG